MSWWYENEEEEMKLYKDEDLCIECKNEFFSKPWDHRDPTPGTIGYCIKCDNFLIKEKKMNEWNYEGLPEKQEMGVSDRVVVAIKGYNTVDVGYYDFDLQAWFVMDNRYPVPVYAWMEVKPPKEEA